MKRSEYWLKILNECEGLTTYDIALYTGYSPGTVQYWKRFFNKQNRVKHKNFINWQSKEYDQYKQLDKSVWDNPQWFYEHYVVKKLGNRILSRLTGLSRGTTYYRLYKYGIMPRTRKEAYAIASKNKFNNKEWLMENYALREDYINWCSEVGKLPKSDGGKGLSGYILADIAKVSEYTLMCWLIKFRIPLRDKYCIEFNKTTAPLDKQAITQELYNTNGLPPSQNQDINKST